MSNKTKARPKMKVWQKIVAVIVIIAELIAIGALYVYSQLGLINRVDNSYLTDSSYRGDISGENDGGQVKSDSSVTNILLIGQDKREPQNSRQRSDTMIIASINKTTSAVTLCSLMRDMYVPIPGYGSNKLNAAYAYGGMQLLDQTIQDNFGIRIDGNVEVDFEGFVNSLSVIGNLDLDLDAEEAAYLNKNGWNLTDGTNSMTPEQVLAFARIRHVGNADWERTERQRQVLIAGYDRMRRAGISETMSAATKMFPYLTTDMSNTDMLKIVYTVVSKDMSLDSDHRLPLEGTYDITTKDGMSILDPNIKANAAALQELLYGKE